MDDDDLEETLNSAKILVSQHPGRAAFFLANKHTKSALDHQIVIARSKASDLGSFGSQSDVASVRLSTSPPQPFPPPRTQNRQPLQGYHTPPASVKSSSERGIGSAGSNCATMHAFDGKGLLRPLRYRKSPICHNWIREEVANRLELGDYTSDGDVVTSAYPPNGLTAILESGKSVELTWCTAKDKPTDYMTCYIVKGNLGADIHVGEQASE